jgi:hypothetical protein
MANTEDMHLIANNFVTDDIGIDERPYAKIIAHRTTALGKVFQTVPAVDKTGGDISGSFWIEPVDIVPDALKIV